LPEHEVEDPTVRANPGIGPALAGAAKAEVDTAFVKMLADTNTLQSPRVSMSDPDALETLKGYLSRNIAVVLTDTHLWDNDVPGTVSFLTEMVDEALAEIKGQDAGLYKAYLRGKNWGREGHWLTHTLHKASATWNWPKLKDVHHPFLWNKSDMYGTYAGINGAADSVKRLQDLVKEPKLMHSDNHCGYAFASTLTGVKAYIMQSPKPEAATADWIEAASTKWITAGGARAYTGDNSMMQDYATLLYPQEIILFPFWMPHAGYAIYDHAWSINGQIRSQDVFRLGQFTSENVDGSLMRAALPRNVWKTCELGTHANPFPFKPQHHL